MPQPSYRETLPGNVQILRWPHNRPFPEEDVLRFFNARDVRPIRWSNGPGDVYGVHDHSYRKTLFCIEGSITFSLTDLGREVELKPGDRLTLPARTFHGATVGPKGATCIEGGEA